MIIEHAIFAVQYAFDVLVDDVPPSVTLQLDRQDFLVSKLINFERDDFDPLAAAMGAEAEAGDADDEQDEADAQSAQGDGADALLTKVHVHV